MQMDPILKQWHPTPDEVERIVAEMRPLIAAMAEAQRSTIERPTRRIRRRPARP